MVWGLPLAKSAVLLLFWLRLKFTHCSAEIRTYMVEVIISSLNGDTFDLQCEPGTTVEELECSFQASQGLSCIRFYQDGREVDGKECLVKAPIGPGHYHFARRQDVGKTPTRISLRDIVSILRMKMSASEHTQCEPVKLDFVVDPTKRRPRRVRSTSLRDGHDHEIRMLLIGDT